MTVAAYRKNRQGKQASVVIKGKESKANFPLKLEECIYFMHITKPNLLGLLLRSLTNMLF